MSEINTKGYVKSCKMFLKAISESFKKVSVDEVSALLDNDSSDLLDQIEDTFHQLNNHVSKIAYCVNKFSKITTESVSFVSDITLFNGLLSLKFLEKENKKTKLVVIKHLDNIFSSTIPFEFKSREIVKTSGSFNPLTSSPLGGMLTQLLSNPALMNGLSGNNNNNNNNNNAQLPNLLQSEPLMNIMKKTTENMNTHNINPMNFLMEVLSGNISEKSKMFAESITDDPDIKPEVLTQELMGLLGNKSN